MENVAADNLNMSNPGKNENLDRIYCQSISKSIADVIRYSLDESFRKRSFKIFGVSSTADTEKEICKKLTALIENKNSKKNQDIIGEGEFMEVERPDPLPGARTSTLNETQSRGVKRSWLKISSQQYRETLKRKRISFYSQPGDWTGCSSNQENCASISNTLEGSNYSNEKFNKLFSSNQNANMKHFSQ